MFPSNYPIEREPKGYQQLTVGNNASGVSLSVPEGATKAVIKVATAPARFRNDGSAPTGATNGFPLQVGNVIELYSEGLTQALFRRLGDTNTALEILYYGSNPN